MASEKGAGTWPRAREPREDGQMALRFAEEITLLMLGDEDGEFVSMPGWSVQCAYAGAVLMDLALENRIDSDPETLVLVDPTPLGDDLLDPTLALIARETKTYDPRHWVEHIADGADEIRECALTRLVGRSILRREDDRFLWVFRSRRYPNHRRQSRAGGKAANHGGAVRRRDPRPARHRHHLSRGRLRHLQGDACRAGGWNAHPRVSSRCASWT